MTADRPVIDPDTIMRRSMPLSELLAILRAGTFESDLCTVFTETRDARAIDDPTCVVDEPVEVADDYEEILPSYATGLGLDRFCLVCDLIDTVDNTIEQRPDADTGVLLANLDHYLAHDTWLDLADDAAH